MSIQRDPHLPPPEVCDWLLAQRWSEVVPAAATTFSGGGYFGLTGWTAYNQRHARAAVLGDIELSIALPDKILQELKQDQGHRRAGDYEDPEADLLQRVLADAAQAEISAFSAIGVLATAATMMVSQCYDLTKLGDDHADA